MNGANYSWAGLTDLKLVLPSGITIYGPYKTSIWGHQGPQCVFWCGQQWWLNSYVVLPIDR